MSGLHRWHVRRRRPAGSAAIEYALLLTVVVAIAMVGFYAFPSTMNRSFAILSDLDAATYPANAAERIRLDETSISTPERRVAARDWQLLSTQLVAVAAMIGLYCSVRLLRRKPKPHDEESPRAAEIPKFKQRQLFQKRQQIYQFLTQHVDTLLNSSLMIRHILSNEPKVVPPTASATEVAELMQSHDIHHILVCGKEGNLVGIISDRDLRREGASTAAELMTPGPITVRPDQQVNQTITLLIQHRISSLPVVNNDGKPIGLVTITDLMLTLQCALQILQQEACSLDSSLIENQRDLLPPSCTLGDKF